MFKRCLKRYIKLKILYRFNKINPVHIACGSGVLMAK